MSFVSNWYTPTKTPPVHNLNSHLVMLPMTGNFLVCK